MNNKENFINVLVDCKGYGEEEAIETAKEYRNSLKSFIEDCGGGKDQIEECKEFLGLPNKAI